MDQNPPIKNHKAWPFQLEVNFCFPRASKMINHSKQSLVGIWTSEVACCSHHWKNKFYWSNISVQTLDVFTADPLGDFLTFHWVKFLWDVFTAQWNYQNTGWSEYFSISGISRGPRFYLSQNYVMTQELNARWKTSHVV